ncbi:hypothetical protein PF003_g34928 [Phytophthora fragariae]|nr:hypothetical protein PF003_g34928 [Phytophthora fragariae]
MEAIVDSIADLTRVELQRNTLVASELIVLLKFSENVCTAAFFVCEFDAPRTTTFSENACTAAFFCVRIRRSENY